MTSAITQRFHRLTDTLSELKVKVRTALATELASTVGTAVRDVLVVALIDRLITPTPKPSSGWRDDDEKPDRWDKPRDPWDDEDDYPPREYLPTKSEYCTPEESLPAVPTIAAVTVGVNVGRWWLARNGTVITAISFGVVTTVLGLAGGPVARAMLAVLAAATDLLTAEATLARSEPI